MFSSLQKRYSSFWAGISIVTKFVVVSVLLFVVVVLSAVQASWNNKSESTPDYIYWQSQYDQLAADFATSAKDKADDLSAAPEVQQVTVQQFPFVMPDGRSQMQVDRCQSCHLGLEDPDMTAENLIKEIDHQTVTAADVPAYLDAHPKMRDIVFTLGCHPGKSPGTTRGDLAWDVATAKDVTPEDVANDKRFVKQMSSHPFATFGCTTCHFGSGRDLQELKAHGNNDFWLQPLMPRKYIDAACAQCHAKHDSTAVAFKATYLPEMTTIAKGQDLFRTNACWGCHKIEGYSKGNVGPELTYEGRIASYHTVEHQLWDPRYKVNNCVMPYFFSKRILRGTDKNGNAVAPYYEDSYGDSHPIGEIVPAQLGNEDITSSLDEHGYIPDSTSQDDVTALVTYVIAQTGLNYTESEADRLARITMYNTSIPPDVPVTAEQGDLTFQQSGCYACHYLGDPNNPKNGKGGSAAPNLSWEGSRHSRQWIDAHYVNPQLFVPKSIMPIFPLSNSQRAALTLFDASHVPTGAHEVSPDQDMAKPTMQSQLHMVDPQYRYMTR